MGSPQTRKYVPNVRHTFGYHDVEYTRSEYGKAYFSSITIILKVHLIQHEKVKGYIKDGETKIKVGKWPKDRWAKFREVYQKEGQNFWDDRFGLENDRTQQYSSLALEAKEELTELERSSYYVDEDKILVDCRFQLKLVDSAAEANTVIKVVYLTQDKFYRSTAVDYSSHDLGETEREAYESGVSVGVILKQKTFLHEIGHAIGLEHVGVNVAAADCIKSVDHNVAACYGDTIKNQGNIMGKGMLLSKNEAAPWIKVAPLFLKPMIWKVYRYVSGW